MKLKNAYKIFNSLVLNILFIGCNQTPSKVQPNLLFPEGQYSQNVQLEITQPNKLSIPFLSLSKIKDGKFKILGLTPFGTKAFEAEGEVEKPENTQVRLHIALPPSIKPEFVKSTLDNIQSLHKLKRRQLKREANFDLYQKQNLSLKIYKMNDEGIPTSFVLEDVGWKAFIQTSHYKPL